MKGFPQAGFVIVLLLPAVAGAAETLTYAVVLLVIFEAVRRFSGRSG